MTNVLLLPAILIVIKYFATSATRNNLSCFSFIAHAVYIDFEHCSFHTLPVLNLLFLYLIISLVLQLLLTPKYYYASIHFVGKKKWFVYSTSQMSLLTRPIISYVHIGMCAYIFYTNVAKAMLVQFSFTTSSLHLSWSDEIFIRKTYIFLYILVHYTDTLWRYPTFLWNIYTLYQKCVDLTTQTKRN